VTLWLLTRLEDPGRDDAEGFVVRAASEASARAFAASQAGDEGRMCWLGDLVRCLEIKPNGEEEVLLRAFNAG